MSINENDISWVFDGEDASAEVLNRPGKELLTKVNSEFVAYGLGLGPSSPLNDLNGLDMNALPPNVNTSGFHGHTAGQAAAHSPSGAATAYIFLRELANNNFQIAMERGSNKYFMRTNDNDWDQLLHTGNILQTTGDSTAYPMSQKAVTEAVTEALDGVLDLPSITWSLSIDEETNTISMWDMVLALSLEIGDVIRIFGSPDGINDKLFTVEAIEDNDTIKVNYEHSGDRANGSLKLEDDYGLVTITRMAKWYNAPTGIGQAWLNVASLRSKGSTYTNTTGRPIQIALSITVGEGTTGKLDVDGVRIGEGVTYVSGGNDGTSSLNFNFIIPPGSEYKYQGGGTITRWAELR